MQTPNLTVITPDVMQMAIRLISGQLNSFQITTDMVGKSLAWTGEMHLLDIDPALLIGSNAPKQKAPVMQAPPQNVQATTSVSGPEQKGHQTYDLVLTALQVDPSKPMNAIQVSDLIEQDTSYLNKRTLQSCVRTVLENMHKKGVVNLHEISGRKHYAIKQAETV